MNIDVDLPDFSNRGDAPKAPPVREAPEVLADDMANPHSTGLAYQLLVKTTNLDCDL